MFASCSVVVLLTSVTSAAEMPGDAAIADAIARAVRIRVGADATVVVTAVDGVRLSGSAATLVATPEPGARTGAPMRFLLSSARPGRPVTRVGEAVAMLAVSAPAVRTTRPMTRGERLTASDVETTTVTLDGVPLRPYLPLEEVLDARAARDLSRDTVLTRMDVAVEPLVRAGDVVRARARVGTVEIVGDMVAAEGGHRGDVIRVVNQETRHAARARVAARGEVELLNVH